MSIFTRKLKGLKNAKKTSILDHHRIDRYRHCIHLGSS